MTGTPLVSGNRVRLLEDGPDTYRAMFVAIAAASDHINMETYILEDDEVGRRFADALIAKQREGVQVNLIYDGCGHARHAGGVLPAPARQRRPHAAVQSGQSGDGDSGLGREPARPPQAADRRWPNRVSRWHQHQQRVLRRLVPSRIAKPRPAGEQPWRDTDLQIEGPVVAEFQKLFLATWHAQKGEPLAPRNFYPTLQAQGKEVVRAIGSSPDDEFSLIYVTLLSAIGSAETEVWLTNAYFVPDPQLLAALKAAAARGVDVRLVLPGRTDSALVFHAGRSYYDQMLQDGVIIFERRDALLHSKTAVIDGVWSTVGSTNFDWRSFLHNQEVNAVVLGTEFGDRMRASFENDVAQSEQITLEQWRQRSVRPVPQGMVFPTLAVLAVGAERTRGRLASRGQSFASTRRGAGGMSEPRRQHLRRQVHRLYGIEHGSG